jgi:NAD(P)H-nitrite reductase large subunit
LADPVAGFIEFTGQRSLGAVHRALSCGTLCGSRVAEVKRLISGESASYTKGSQRCGHPTSMRCDRAAIPARCLQWTL